MVSNGELLQISAGDNSYHALPASLELLGKSLARSRLEIFSPFNNLLIRRKRTQALFGFDYLLERYRLSEIKFQCVIGRRYTMCIVSSLWPSEI